MADPRRRVAALATAVLLVSGCGGQPDRAEFISRMRSSVGDLDAAMSAQGIEPELGDRLIDELVDCQYEAIADDPDLVRKAYDDPGAAEVVTEIDVAARACIDTFTSAMTAAADPPATTVPTVPTTASPGAPPIAPPSTPTTGG